MRVGFTLIGGRDWTGGYNYLLNLVRVLRSHPDCGVDPVLFVGSDVADEQVAEFAPLLTQAPIRSAAFDRRFSSLRLARACTLGNVPTATEAFEDARSSMAGVSRSRRSPGRRISSTATCRTCSSAGSGGAARSATGRRSPPAAS
jgi:hypothetical protein